MNHFYLLDLGINQENQVESNSQEVNPEKKLQKLTRIKIYYRNK